MNVYVNARLLSGRMVRCVYRRGCTRNKRAAWTWEETSDTGGTYDDLYEWMRLVRISYREPVRFELETDEPRPEEVAKNGSVQPSAQGGSPPL